MPAITCANPACPRNGVPFYAKTARALYCSEACKKAARRSNAVGTGQRITDPIGTLDCLQEKHGYQQGASLEEQKAKWVRANDVTHNLVRRDKVLARVVDRGPHWASDHQVRWAVVMGEDSISPNDIEAMGYRADLATAKAIAEAWLTGRLAPVVVKNLHDDDCTEDAWLELRGMLSLLGYMDITLAQEEPTEEPTEDFSTEDQMVARLNRHWAVVISSDGDCWVLQHRIGDGDVWQQAGRFKRRDALIHTIEQQAGQVTPEAMSRVRALPEKPGTPG